MFFNIQQFPGIKTEMYYPLLVPNLPKGLCWPSILHHSSSTKFSSVNYQYDLIFLSVHSVSSVKC